MGTIASGVQVMDKTYGAYGGTADTDRTWAMYPGVRTFGGMVAADLTGTNALTLQLGSPRLPTNPYGGAAVTTQFRVIGMRILFGGAVTAHASNNATFTFNHRTSAGASAVALGTVDTTSGGTGTTAQGQSVDVAITAANSVMVASGTLECALTKNASGVTIPAGTRVEVDVVPVA